MSKSRDFDSTVMKKSKQSKKRTLNIIRHIFDTFIIPDILIREVLQSRVSVQFPQKLCDSGSRELPANQLYSLSDHTARTWLRIHEYIVQVHLINIPFV